MSKLREFALWLGRHLIAWAIVRPSMPYAYRSLSDAQAADLRAVFEPKGDWLDSRCPTCHAPWSEHRCPYIISTTRDARSCGECGVGLPVDSVKTHDGRWLCKSHKLTPYKEH